MRNFLWENKWYWIVPFLVVLATFALMFYITDRDAWNWQMHAEMGNTLR